MADNESNGEVRYSVRLPSGARYTMAKPAPPRDGCEWPGPKTPGGRKPFDHRALPKKSEL